MPPGCLALKDESSVGGVRAEAESGLAEMRRHPRNLPQVPRVPRTILQETCFVPCGHIRVEKLGRNKSRRTADEAEAALTEFPPELLLTPS